MCANNLQTTISRELVTDTKRRLASFENYTDLEDIFPMTSLAIIGEELY